MLEAFLWPFAVVVGWGLIFAFSIFLSRLGISERDAETNKQIEEEADKTTAAGWTPLLS